MREALVSGRRILAQASRANRLETMSSSQVRLLISDTRDLASDSWGFAAMNSASVRRLQFCSHPSRPSSALLLGSCQVDTTSEMESQKCDVVLRFSAGSEIGPSRQLFKERINELRR